MNEQAPETSSDSPETRPDMQPESAQLPQKRKPSAKPIIIAAVLIGIIGVAAGMYFLIPSQLVTRLVTGRQDAKSVSDIPLDEPELLLTTGGLNGDIPLFAEYREQDSGVTPKVPDYTLTASDLPNLGDVERAYKPLSEAQKNALASAGFFLTPAPNKLEDGDVEFDFSHGAYVDEFLINYDDIAGETQNFKRKPENTVFITGDLLLHVYHVFIDRTFQYIEETKFHPTLLALTDALYEQARSQAEKTQNPKTKESFARLTAYFLIPKVLLESSIPSPETQNFGYSESGTEREKALTDDAGADSQESTMAIFAKYRGSLDPAMAENIGTELGLIAKSDGFGVSPVFGTLKGGEREDYTQYKPRSHYTKNSLLRSFWRAMIWYGRFGFLTKSDELTLDAANITILLSSLNVAGTPAATLWESIYLPTVFFVGKSDDLTLYDYGRVLETVYGKGAKPDDLPDPEKFVALKAEIKKLKGPMIMSSIVMIAPGGPEKSDLLNDTKSFRFMGQRFIPDSFIFSELTQGDEAPDEETGQKLPPIPTALMPMSIFGSARAEFYLNDWIRTEAPDSGRVIAKEKKRLSESFGKLTLQEWTQNLYWTWLHSLRSLFTVFGAGYPKFMQGELWADKNLNTAMGSWTELRHDTLLYAKQSYAEMGGGGEPPEPPPVPKGYVEPNMQLLNRLIALSEMTKAGLKKTNVMPEVQEGKLDSFIRWLTFYRDIAAKELANEKISDEDFEKLRTSIPYLNDVLTPPGSGLSFMPAREARAGIIADVHTATTQAVQEILYEGTGIPHFIYVAVKDTNGTRLTRGLVYSQYEFTRPFGSRLSDQDWQALLYERSNAFPVPALPAWVRNVSK